MKSLKSKINLLDNIVNKLLKLSRFEKIFIVVFLDVFLVLFSIWASISIRLGEFFFPSGNEHFIFLISLFLGPLVFWQCDFYKVVFRFLGQKHFYQILKASGIFIVSWVFIIKIIFPNYLNIEISFFPRSVPFILFITLNFSLILLRLSANNILNFSNFKNNKNTHVVIFGAGINGKNTFFSLINNRQIRVIGILDENSYLHNKNVYGYKVLGGLKELKKIKSNHKSFTVLLIDPEVTLEDRLTLFDECEKLDIPIRSIPDVSRLINDMSLLNIFREITPGQLLGRKEIENRNNELNLKKSNSILVTGAGGSIGSELVLQLIPLSAKNLILLDNSEYNLYSIKEKIDEITKNNKLKVNIIYLLGSINDTEILNDCIKKYNVDTVFHAAAYKHVNLVQLNPLSAIKNNVIGTFSLIKSVKKFGVKNFVLISTDKAVRPSTLMGKTKRVSELIVQSSFAYLKKSNKIDQVFSIVRFGNVLESSGSVIPIFKRQIATGGPVTVTHKEVTRYFMTIPEASRLVIEASDIAIGGEVFVLDMGDPIKIDQLAKKLIRLSGFNVYDDKEKDNNIFKSIKIKYVGLGKDEKLHEELIIGEKIQKTKIPKILKAEETFINWDTLEKKLTKLDQAIINNDEEKAHKQLDDILS